MVQWLPMLPAKSSYGALWFHEAPLAHPSSGRKALLNNPVTPDRAKTE